MDHIRVSYHMTSIYGIISFIDQIFEKKFLILQSRYNWLCNSNQIFRSFDLRSLQQSHTKTDLSIINSGVAA